MKATFVEPEGWARGSGYAHGVIAEGRVLALAGLVGWDPRTQQLATGGFEAQARQAIANIVELLRSGGGELEHLVRVTWYITSRKQFVDAQKAVDAAWREHFGTHAPARNVLIVAALLEPGALLQLEALAVLPA